MLHGREVSFGVGRASHGSEALSGFSVTVHWGGNGPGFLRLMRAEAGM